MFLSAAKCYRNGAFISHTTCLKSAVLTEILSCKLDSKHIPAGIQGKKFSYAIEAIMLYFNCVFVRMCLYFTFSAHAHRPMPKNAAPSNCKTKSREEASPSDGKKTWNNEEIKYETVGDNNSPWQISENFNVLRNAESVGVVRFTTVSPWQHMKTTLQIPVTFHSDWSKANHDVTLSRQCLTHIKRVRRVTVKTQKSPVTEFSSKIRQIISWSYPSVKERIYLRKWAFRVFKQNQVLRRYLLSCRGESDSLGPQVIAGRSHCTLAA